MSLPYFYLFKGQNFAIILSCLFPGMQAKIVQELIVAVHDMLLYTWKNVFSEVGLGDQNDKTILKGNSSNFPKPCATDRER